MRNRVDRSDEVSCAPSRVYLLPPLVVALILFDIYRQFMHVVTTSVAE